MKLNRGVAQRIWVRQVVRRFHARIGIGVVRPVLDGSDTEVLAGAADKAVFGFTG